MILAAMQSAAIRLLGQKPTAFFAATNQFEVEIADLANEVAQDVAKYRDWRALIREGEIDGDGTATSFALPPDYDRMLLRSDMQDAASWLWGYGQISDYNDFVFYRDRGFATNPGGYYIGPSALEFAPAPTGTATYPYITLNYARPVSGVDKPVFTLDTDTFLLPERLLTLGLIWRWRENKKLDASGDQEAFIKALDEYAAKDGGSRIIRQNSRRAWPGTRVTWPWALGGV